MQNPYWEVTAFLTPRSMLLRWYQSTENEKPESHVGQDFGQDFGQNLLSLSSFGQTIM